MSERGYLPWLDDDGVEVYAEFTVDSYETVALHLRESNFGAAPTDLDLSNASLNAYFRASVVGSATVPVNVLLAKVNTGSDGKVSEEVVFRATDFTGAIGEGASIIEKSCVIVNSSVADANTLSGFKERQWYSRSTVFLRPAMNST